MVGDVAKLKLPGKEELSLPVLKGTMGPDVIDIAPLSKIDVFTFDPGFRATAACESKITFIDGNQGILLHRGYPIEQLAEHSDFLEVCYLLLFGELPDAQQKEKFICECGVTYSRSNKAAHIKSGRHQKFIKPI